MSAGPSIELDEMEILRDYAVTQDDDGVYDEAENQDEEVPVRYVINSYGADFVVDVLIKRLRNKDIKMPDFQRQFVWNSRDASRFIESLLMGLPVPGIFLSRDEDKKLLVVDGQQRLKSLLAYFDNDFKDRPFKLSGVSEPYNNRRYSELDEPDRRTLDDAVIHATIIQQTQPSDDDSGIYSVFERLNNGGRKLYPQEIRASILPGRFTAMLDSLNANADWRKLYGKQKSPRLKDIELILRFFALRYRTNKYEKPMKTFLNKFMKANRELGADRAAAWGSEFARMTARMSRSLGEKAFRPSGKAFNAAVFDAVSVGFATATADGDALEDDAIAKRYDALLKDKAFVETYTRATSDVDSVKSRIELAIAAFEV